MKLIVVVLTASLMIPGTSFAAKCKVNGEWYDYDSPQCLQGQEELPPVEDSSLLEQPVPSPDQPHARNPVAKQSWKAVEPAVQARCGQTANAAAAQSCRYREELGYWAMHGNFAMPPDEAERAKRYCASKTDSFEGQMRCMESESRGYHTAQDDGNMPLSYASQARSTCLKQHQAWTIRGSCMRQAEDLYSEGPKSKSVRPPQAVTALAAVSEYQPPPGYAGRSDLQKFAVDPDSVDDPVLAFTPTIPEPLHISQRAFLIGVQSEDFPTIEAFEAALESRSSTARLSAARPSIDGVGSLSFASARLVNAKRDVANLDSNEGGAVHLHLDVEGGLHYLVEFVVKSHHAGVYQLKSGPDIRTIEDPVGALTQVIALIVAESGGTARLALSKDLAHGFEFHAVQVTSFSP